MREGKILMRHILECEPPHPSAAGAALFISKYGSPFGSTPGRYTFWASPVHYEGMPLLAFAASLILVAQGAGMIPERLHSAIGMLTRKFRAKTTPDNSEMMTLCRHWLLKEQAAKLEHLDVGDLDEIEHATEGGEALPDVP